MNILGENNPIKGALNEITIIEEEPAAPEVAAIWVSTDLLRPWAGNPRKNDRAVGIVAESIQKFGFGNPLLCRRANGEVIAGHTRLKAALRLGLTTVPVRYMDLSADDAHLLSIADNCTGEIAAWDDEKLANILSELRTAEKNLLVGTGLTEADIRRLIGADGSPGARGTDPGPGSLPEEPISKPSEVYQLSPHRLMCGSCTVKEDIDKLMSDERALWMLADAPYDVSYVGGWKEKSVKERLAAGGLTIDNDDEAGLPALLKAAFVLADSVLADGSPFYIFHPSGGLSLEFGKAILEVGWKFHQTLIWIKNNHVLGRSDYHYKHEPIIYGWKEPRVDRTWIGGRDKMSILAYDRPLANTEHPTMKPLDLIVHLLTNSAERGSLGYDPFCGSGATIIAAQKIGARCYALEIDPKYCDVIRRRWTGYCKSAGIDPGPGALE